MNITGVRYFLPPPPPRGDPGPVRMGPQYPWLVVRGDYTGDPSGDTGKSETGMTR